MSFRGSAPRGALVAVQRRAGGHWRGLVRGMADGKGRFVLTTVAPGKRGSLAVRAVVLGGRGAVATSRSISVRVLAAKKGSRAVVVSARDQVLDPSVVSSAPVPGSAGTLRYAGGNLVQTGQIIAIGQGPATPDGFLGRVTRVRTRNGQVIVSTVPATLLQAVPSGSIDETFSQSASQARDLRRTVARAAAAAVTCHGTAAASIKPAVSPPSVKITLKGSWKLFGGLQSASLTADAGTSATLTATVSTAGSCTLPSTPVLQLPGPKAAFAIGPIPVVITSKITVYLNASASAQAAVTSSASVGMSASAGIGWQKGRGYYPIETFTPSFGYQPPQLSASASVGAYLTPTVDVLLYGVAGPEIALNAGLQFNANVNQNPWWTLDAPVDLTAQLAAPALNLFSPKLHVYQRTFRLANAAGAFSNTGGGGGGGGGAGGGGGGAGGGGAGGGGGPSQGTSKFIVGNTAADGNGPIQTYDIGSGALVNSFVPDAAANSSANGRAIAVVGNEVFYTELGNGYASSDAIHVAPFNGGAGGSDTRTLPNPASSVGIQDLSYSNGALYAMTGYGSGPLQVWKLDPASGAVLAGPTTINSSSSADGFVVLPDGNYLINGDDESCTYTEYDSATGAPTGSSLTVPGANICTGVDTDGTALYFQTDFDSFTKTDLAGNLLTRISTGSNSEVEDISLAGG